MPDSSARAREWKKSNFRAAGALCLVCSVVVVAVLAFLGFYNSFIDKTLYAERLNQMREVTTQLFSGLESAVKNEWQIVSEQERALKQRSPETLDGLYAFMDNQVYLSDMEATQSEIVAIDSTGTYYSRDGRQGLLSERSYLIDGPDEITFVSNSLTFNQTRMVFLKRLDDPITVQGSSGTVEISYYGITQSMEELNPYFECAAYNGHNSVYVIDNDGLKLFSSSSSSSSSEDELLQGYNILTTLDGMDYLHGSSFEGTQNDLAEHGIAYSNAVLNGQEVYYSLYRMDNAVWTLVFLVPSQYVATNTVDLVNTTKNLVMAFALILIAVSVFAIFWLMRSQQKTALAIERRNSDRLELLNTELERASRAKSSFLANMSHDIRTPMNAIVGITNLMEHEKDDPEKLDAYIHKVQSSSKHLLSLINDVLDMSKIESSEISLNRESINLADQVGQVESIIRPQAEERGQRFTIRVHEISHEYLIGDAVRLRQVFINLLSNAIKYTPNGGIVNFDLAELPSSEEGRARIGITVADNGCGMTPEFAERIFDPFTRAENSTTNKEQGTGLGMAITKSIVDLSGGTIEVKSVRGKGSLFKVELPLDIDENAKPDLNAETVLLISREDALIDNARAALSSTDVVLFVARSKAEADAVLAANEIDTILLSGHVADPDLADIVAMLREQAAHAVLVFCVDYGQKDQALGFVNKTGVDGLIPRPFFLSNFANAVNQIRGNAVASEEPAGSLLSGMRFLCAEDNALNAEILAAILDMNGASCTIYPNGRKLVEAFETVAPGDYDAILMDVQMPVMNGLEATRAIRSGENPLGATIPVIAMTANAFSSDVCACLDAGMDAHVSKPLEVTVLERTLRSVLRGGGSGGGSSFVE